MCSNFVVSGVVPPLKNKNCTTIKIIEDQFHVFGGVGVAGSLYILAKGSSHAESVLGA